jgi:hypothetical protein
MSEAIVAKVGKQVRHKFVVRSLINSEGGNLRFSTKYPDLCGTCEIGDEALGPFPACATCGRAPNQGGRVISGDGDGIFPVIEVIDLEGDPSTPVAVLVVFDSNYELANRLKNEAANGQKPTLSLADFERFVRLPTADVTSLSASSTIVLGGGSKSEPAVDCAISPATPTIARVFIEQAGQYTGNFGSFNEGNDADVSIPRLLTIGPEAVLETVFGTPSRVAQIDWQREDFLHESSLVTSHALVVADDLCHVNAEIADSYLQDISQDENRIRNWDEDFFSWILLGSQLEESWCSKMLETTFGVPDSAEQAELLSRRVFALTVQKVTTGKLPIVGVANFCPECGSRFGDVNSKYCSNCGHPRPALAN